MKYKEIYFLCDLSTNMNKNGFEDDVRDDIFDVLNDVVKESVWSIEELAYPYWNVYVNLLVFDGGVFSGRRNIISRHRSVNNYDPPVFRVNSPKGAGGSIDGMFRAALDMSLSQYRQWMLQGVDATPALFIYIGDGTKELGPDFLRELHMRLKHNNIDIRAFALNTYYRSASTKNIEAIVDMKEHIAEVHPLEMIDQTLFLEIFS